MERDGDLKVIEEVALQACRLGPHTWKLVRNYVQKRYDSTLDALQKDSITKLAIPKRFKVFIA